MSTTLEAKIAEKTGPNQQHSKQQVVVKKVFVKGLMFDAASLTPENFKASSDANIEMQAFVNISQREDETTEVVLSLHLTAKVNGSLLWRIQLQQAGFYELQGFSDEEEKRVLNGYCANQLYQYACVIVNNAVTQGGFSPVFLAPMNFEALYQQQLKQDAK